MLKPPENILDCCILYTVYIELILRDLELAYYLFIIVFRTKTLASHFFFFFFLTCFLVMVLVFLSMLQHIVFLANTILTDMLHVKKKPTTLN